MAAGAVSLNQSTVSHEGGSTMNLKNANNGGGIGRIAVISLLALVSGGGCSTVSCKWANTSLADGAPVSATNQIVDPCWPAEADQYSIQPLLGKSRRR